MNSTLWTHGEFRHLFGYGYETLQYFAGYQLFY